MALPLLHRRVAPARGAPFGLESVTAQSLALVPLVVGLLFGALVLPRAVAPEELPLPTIDGAALGRTLADDDARAARARSTPLASPVRAVGSAFRGFNGAESDHADETAMSLARDAIFRANRDLRDQDIEGLLDLRAYQMTSFLAEVRRLERTHEVSPELRELGGTFVDRMSKVGWFDGSRLLMPDAARRAAFKLTWTRAVLLDGDRRFALTLDETRALYSFYLRHPHVPEGDRRRLEAAAQEPMTAASRERIEESRAKAEGGWLLVKVGELSQSDPSYPSALGRAAALYRKHDYRGAAAIYEVWLHANPDGVWTLRVQNYLRAALIQAEKAFQ